MQTIVELPEFQKKASNLLNDAEKASIINYLASHPQSGDLMQGTGGIRKLRWSAQGRGKSSKSNLSKTERNELAKFTFILLKNYGGSDG